MTKITKEEFYNLIPEESVVHSILHSDLYYLNDKLVGEVSYWADRTDYLIDELLQNPKGGVYIPKK